MFALIEGIGLRQISAWILHELLLRILAAEAVGLALNCRVDGAISLHVLVIGEAPGTHIVELPGHGKGRSGQPQCLARSRSICSGERRSRHRRQRRRCQFVTKSNAIRGVHSGGGGEGTFVLKCGIRTSVSSRGADVQSSSANVAE